MTGGSPRLLIVRLGSLGDVVHAIPVAAALRGRFPGARIDWLVDPRYEDLLRLVPSVTRSIPLDPRGGRGRVLATLREARQVFYDAAIDLQGLIKSAVLARAAGARRTIGFPRAHLREPLARLLYTDAPDPGPNPHVIYKNLALLEALDVRERRVMFPLSIPRTPAADRVVGEFGPRGYALINPGAAWPNKRWPSDRFGVVAAAMRHRLGLPSIVLWGPGEEDLASAVVDASHGSAVRAPATSIGDLVGIAHGARLLVSGDTGPLHIAAAVGTPIVALFGPTRPERNGPWAAADITVSRVERCTCLYQRRCHRGDPCIDDIAVDEVMAAVETRFRRDGVGV